MEIDSELLPSLNQEFGQRASQLRPRLEASYLGTRNTSVVALDQPIRPIRRREPPSQVLPSSVSIRAHRTHLQSLPAIFMETTHDLMWP